MAHIANVVAANWPLLVLIIVLFFGLTIIEAVKWYLKK